MFVSSVTAVSLLVSVFINPHPNYSTIYNNWNAPIFQAHNSCLIKESFWENLYNQSLKLKLKYTIRREAKTLNKDVINKVVTSLYCAQKYHINHKPILTVIDYSLPANKKRLWVFDLNKGKLLYHTYVGHGITSGSILTNHFSNRNNSKASSIGVYVTDQAYYGREGMSMRLTGLERYFNNNAANRYIVMHGGWYMDPEFIETYGRAGRSWGCPALPKSLNKDIINTIKDHTFMVMYYPSKKWLAKSRFLNCDSPKNKNKIEENLEPIDVSKAERDSVIFAPFKKEKAILVLSADEYSKTFQSNPPLQRMLRRQIAKEEYIALSTTELDMIINSANSQQIIDKMHFVIPVVRNHRGYYQTSMEFVKHPEITKISTKSANKFTLHFDSGNAMQLSTSNHFIRWLGL